MYEEIIRYIIIIILAIIVGIFGNKLSNYRNTVEELRNDNSGSESENRRARERYKDAQRIIKEIREEQQIKE